MVMRETEVMSEDDWKKGGDNDFYESLPTWNWFTL
jgi:hypothetical protein